MAMAQELHGRDVGGWTRTLHKSLAKGLARPMNTGLSGAIGRCASSSQRGDDDPHAARAPFASLRTPRRTLYSQHEPMTRDARCMQVAARRNATGGWTVDDYLGNGFSAVVLSATRGDIRAALKVIDPEMAERYGTDRQLARVVREKRLEEHRHPHLVQIFDGGQCEDTGHLYVVMELLEPLTLGDVRDTLPTDRIGPSIHQLSSAARFLEEHDLVHRDIKPDNTNISSDYSTVKLLDLGVVHPPRDSGDPSAGTGNYFLGTARYSPPEFLHRQEVNNPEGWRAITFYQLGATLFDLITRTPIFDDFREPQARLYEAIKDHVPIIVPASHDVEPWLVDLARKCLTKDWRIREQLVTWDSFAGPTEAADSADEIRERIRARVHSATDLVSIRTSVNAPQPSRRMLIDLFRNMSTMIREGMPRGRSVSTH